MRLRAMIVFGLAVVSPKFAQVLGSPSDVYGIQPTDPLLHGGGGDDSAVLDFWAALHQAAHSSAHRSPKNTGGGRGRTYANSPPSFASAPERSQRRV